MDSPTQESHFETLDGLILDEDKIVTCSTAAYALKIPLKDAKEILAKYVQDRRKSKVNELAVTYVVSGLLPDGSLGLSWVEEDDLSEKMASFAKVTSELINSVQKCKAIDLNIISFLDYETKEESLPGCVVGTNCYKRDMKVKKSIPLSNPVKEKKSFFSKIPPKDEAEKVKPTTSNETVKPKIEPKTQSKKGGIANFFTKAPVVKSEQKNGNEFKESSRSKTESDVQDLPDEKENLPEKVVKMEVDEDKLINESSVLTPSENVAEKSNKKPVDKKRKSKSKESDKPSKRRRRIQDNFDSDSSDDIFGESEEDIIEKSFEEPVPEPPPKFEPPLPTKSKCRKEITKTFMDEEGFCVTKVEYVFESDDEKEEPPMKIMKKESSKVLEKKNSTTDSETELKNQKKGKKNKKIPAGNQPTLMNFFKKA